MENKLIVRTSELFGQVRFIRVNEKEYAVGKDVAIALGYKNTNDAIIRHCKGVVKHEGLKINGIEIALISEGDIYRLITHSKLPQAEKFETWVFDEVLPTIRKTGGYVNNDDLFTETYMKYADEETKLMFKASLKAIRDKDKIIQEKQKELDHKQGVIIGLVDEIELAEKRQVLNRVVRYKGANFQERWRELYKQFEMKYHIDLGKRLKSFNEANKPKLKSKVDYIDKVLNKVPELYEIACKLYENDIKQLMEEIYEIN